MYLRVEAAYAAAAEGALHLEDILSRRMRISIEYPHRGVDCAREVAETVAPILNWSPADVDREVATYLARVEAEVLSQTQPDDASADALRAAAPEARAEILGTGAARLRPPPLPPRDGLGPARVRLRGGAVLVELADRFGRSAAARVLAGEVVDADGAVITAATVLPPGATSTCIASCPTRWWCPTRPGAAPRPRTSWWWTSHTSWRPCRVAGTSPRPRWYGCAGNRAAELSPAHRLDRLTAGVLLFTTRREVRGAVPDDVRARSGPQTYLAQSSAAPTSICPPWFEAESSSSAAGYRLSRSREPNAETPSRRWATVLPAHPGTGRTHQLRVHMAGLGLPIDNDPLYPDVIDVAADDFTAPLRLVAHRLNSTTRSPANRVASCRAAASPTIRTDRPGDPMSNPVDDRPVNLKAFGNLPPDAPVVMINLLKFHPGDGLGTT